MKIEDIDWEATLKELKAHEGETLFVKYLRVGISNPEAYYKGLGFFMQNFPHHLVAKNANP